jgi:hypothetical protein
MLLVQEIESGFDSVTAEDNCADGIGFHEVVREAQGHSSGCVQPLKLCRGKRQVQAAGESIVPNQARNRPDPIPL